MLFSLLQFSPKLEKLFVQLDKACPVNFQLNIHPSMFSSYQVRGQLVYSKAEDFHDSVERCINHQQKGMKYPTLFVAILFLFNQRNTI